MAAPQTRVRVGPAPCLYIFSAAAAKTNTVCSSSRPCSEGQRTADVVPAAAPPPFVALWRLRTCAENGGVLLYTTSGAARPVLPPRIGPRQIESWRDDHGPPCLSSGHHRAATLIASGFRSAKSPRGEAGTESVGVGRSLRVHISLRVCSSVLSLSLP